MSAASPSHGEFIGKYRIERKIGSGGMGEVYLATDTKLDRQVALKILPQECCINDDRLSRFVLEARAVSALNHPNILTIYEIDELDDTHYIATEFIDGEMLLDRLERQELSVGEVIDIGVQIASALATAHETGIVHRDIKPGNIMIRRDGLVKVLDFGIAKLAAPETIEVDSEAETQVHFKTLEGRIVGTVGYMSPEQARGKSVDARSDIWSLGCVMYEMLTNRQAFRGDTIADVLANVINREPASILSFRKDIPPELERIVLKALNKCVDDRYSSARELADDLKNLQTRMLVEVEQSRSGAFAAPVQERINDSNGSIVILPFADISPEGDNRYFSEGLTEEIIISLSKLKSLKVVARSAAMKYVSEPKSHQEIAGEFGVRYVLEGSVRRHRDELRITSQLVDAENQTYLWAETFRGTIEDVFEIQEEVAG